MISDIISAQAEALIVAAIQAKFPDMDLRPTTPQYDTAVRFFLPIVAEIVNQLDIAETKRSAANYSQLTPEEVAAEAARYFTTPMAGGISTGSIRLKFTTPQDVSLTIRNAFTQNGLTYNPAGPLLVPAVNLIANQVGQNAVTYYYTDIVVNASAAGSQYDTGPGVSFSVDAYAGSSSFIEAISTTPISGGSSDETPAQLYARIQTNQTTRNLVGALSIEAVLSERFQGTIQRMVVVGHSEPEMKRGLRQIVDPVFGQATIALGGFTDVFVQTPIMRESVEFVVPANTTTVDISAYAPVLKIHSVSLASDPTVQPFWSLSGASPQLRYSADDDVQLVIDPGVTNQTIVVDMSHAPDVAAINSYCNSDDVRLVCADLLVRYMIPVWLSGNIFIEGGFGLENQAIAEINGYLFTLFPGDPLVVSKLTEAIHRAGVGSVFQDYEITGEVQLPTPDNAIVTISDSKVLRFDQSTIMGAADAGFSARVSVLINEGIVVTAIT